MTCTAYLPQIERIYYATEFDFFLTGDTVLIGDQSAFVRLDCVDDQSLFTEKLIIDSKGKYFVHELSVLFTHFNNDDGYALDSNLAFLLFSNNTWYVIGYYSPMSLNKQENSLTTDANKQSLTFTSNSYQKVRTTVVNESCSFSINSIFNPISGYSQVRISVLGYATYNDATTYSVGNHVYFQNKIYISLQNSNVDNTPSEIGSTYWAFVRDYKMLFSIDNINWQSSDIFYPIPVGAHTFYVRDTQALSCKKSLSATIT